ncbi:unnamed protein product [Lactuca saligna]|uniref:Cytochrome P450 n=1 Tax=Lactuca saligna TaxID=75948 RepID=A0AA36ECC5_LACSI|nr:unnamed protein product [Lactuca saligna]
MTHRYGPIFSLRLGRKLHVVVNSLDLVKVVTRDLDLTMANRSPPLAALTISYGGNGIVWSNSNTHWRNMRNILAIQLLSITNFKDCQGFRTYEVRRLVKEVYTNLNFKILKLLGAPNISDFLPVLSRFDLQGRQREMQRQLEYVDRIFESIIQGRMEANSRINEGEGEEDRRKDFLQILLELMEQKDATISLDIIKIKALLMDIVLAATDTTSTMVEWVMSEVLNNPCVMRTVQDELTDVIGMNVVEESHLPKLTYLDAVINETLGYTLRFLS